MFGLSIKIEDTTSNLQREADRGMFRGFSHAAASIRKDAVASVQKAEGPSQPGTPVHTHRGMRYRRAIRFEANKEGAVIGPRHSVVGTSGEAHEHGRRYRGRSYRQRAVMGPALKRKAARLGSSFKGVVGG